jgi:chromate transporter
LPKDILDVALYFLKLGTTAFGGPAAHIALMHDEVVKRRKWLDDQRFLDLLGAANIIPGPTSTELAIHIGYQHAGWIGLVLGGVCFIMGFRIFRWRECRVARINGWRDMAVGTGVHC